MRSVSPQSPEQRRKRLVELKAKFGAEVAEQFKPDSTPWAVIKRVALGVYSDGFIHAGNLAYLAVLALFPFFILAAAVAHLFGQSQDAILTVNNVLQRLPPNVADIMRDPIREVLTQRTGPLLWFGGIVGLWTAASFVETIRDILRRSYGVEYSAPFWTYRLSSIALILGAVILMMIALRSVGPAGVDPRGRRQLVPVRGRCRHEAGLLPARPGDHPLRHFLFPVLGAHAFALSQEDLPQMAWRPVRHGVVALSGRNPAAGDQPARRLSENLRQPRRNDGRVAVLLFRGPRRDDRAPNSTRLWPKPERRP